VPEGDVRALSVPLPQVAILTDTRVGRQGPGKVA
jgi:hypothetical protein